MTLNKLSVSTKTKRWKGPSVRRKKRNPAIQITYELEDPKNAYETPAKLNLYDIATITFSHGVEHGQPFEVRGKDLAYFAQRKVCGNIIGVMTEDRLILELVDIDMESGNMEFYTLIVHRCNLRKHLFSK
jgi:hypothetical protein